MKTHTNSTTTITFKDIEDERITGIDMKGIGPMWVYRTKNKVLYTIIEDYANNSIIYYISSDNEMVSFQYWYQVLEYFEKI